MKPTVGRIFRRGTAECPYCGVEMVRPSRAQPTLRTATVDHMIPTSRGGCGHFHNLIACCWYCNHIKSWLTAEEFMTVIGDDRARKALLKTTRPPSAPAPVPPEERFRRRMEALASRLREPDPDCLNCSGSGIYTRRDRQHVCRCAVINPS